MGFANGQAPRSALAPIHNGMLLRKDAAAAFNAMDAEAVRRFGRHIGVRDAYRIIGRPGDLDRNVWSQWAAHEREQRGGNDAADPGTSNHGLALAADLFDERDRWIVDQIGAEYGWSKAWSDAPGEWWHVKWREGVWTPKPLDVLDRLRLAPLKRLARSQDLRAVQTYLKRGGYLPKTFKVARKTGTYGPAQVAAVKRFQRHVGLEPDGVIGAKTFAALRRRYGWRRWLRILKRRKAAR